VLSHADNIQATGFLEHIKLPHYVDFQSELELVRKIRRATQPARTSAPSGDLAAPVGEAAE
jgi:alpha-D-ribose 1-methylphosphonate 5-triphosphate synthase subunit PhnI